MSRTLYCVLGTGLLCAVFQLSAQAPDPPKVLRIIREDVKEGKTNAHEQSEARFAQALIKNKFPANQICVTTLTGPAQVWFLEGHESFVSAGTAIAATQN